MQVESSSPPRSLHAIEASRGIYDTDLNFDGRVGIVMVFSFGRTENNPG